jgi:hypothetical protein
MDFKPGTNEEEKNILHTDENRYPVSFLDSMSQHGMEKTVHLLLPSNDDRDCGFQLSLEWK